MITLTLTENQAKTLNLACETMARLYMGQMDVLSNVREDQMLPGGHDTAKQIKELVFPWKNSNPDALPDEAKQLWDMYQVLRHYLAWKDQPNTPATRDWKTQMTVNFDEPMKRSKEPLPLIRE